MLLVLVEASAWPKANKKLLDEQEGSYIGKLEGGLNFTRFADSRKGGGNAMGKGGGSREREWDILTVTYRQRAEQSRAEQSRAL